MKKRLALLLSAFMLACTACSAAAMTPSGAASHVSTQNNLPIQKSVQAAPLSSAQPVYTTSIVPLPQEGLGKTGHLLDVYVHPNGSIDFIAYKENGKRREAARHIYYHYYSPDGGKTWTIKNVDWIKKTADKYGVPVLNFINSMYVAEDGTIYAIVLCGEETNDDGKDVQSDYLHKIVKVTNGTVQEVPNLTLSQKGVQYYTIAAVLDNGDLAVTKTGKFGTKRPSGYFAVNPKTGAVKGQIEYPGVPCGYAGGVISSTYTKNSGASPDLIKIDVNTGKEIGRARLDMKTLGSPVNQKCTSKTGNVYYATEKGLYLLTPNATAFTKVIDGAASGLSGKVSSSGVTADTYGNVYCVVCYYDTTVDDPKNDTEWRMYCYTPITK